MAWYRSGTVTTAASSTTVTGSGTMWVANARVGDAIYLGGQGIPYEITNIASDTALSINPAFTGTEMWTVGTIPPGPTQKVTCYGVVERVGDLLSSSYVRLRITVPPPESLIVSMRRIHITAIGWALQSLT